MIETIETHLYGRGQGPVEIAFFGGTFTALPVQIQKKCLDLAARYVVEEELAGIRLSTRPDDLDQEKIDLLLAYPVVAVELGAQSLDDAVLKKNGRGHSVADIEGAVDRLKQVGMPVVLQLMLGLDGSDAPTDLKSVSRALALEPAALRLYPTVVLADTALGERYERGAYRPLTTVEAVQRTADALDLSAAAGISCLRVGLPAEGLIDNKAVLAGPIHSNFGQLVADERRIRRICALVGPDQRRLEIVVPTREKGDYAGYKRQISKYFQNRDIDLVVHGDPSLGDGQICVKEGGEQTCT